MKRARLFTPGPTAVPNEVLETQARPLIHHRTAAFRAAHERVLDGLRHLMRTDNPVVVLASSGTGAMEAAVVNTTAPGEKVLVTVNGKFSERWRQIAEAYGLTVVPEEAPWGEPIRAEQIESALSTNPDVAVVFATHSETSTGVLQDVEAFAHIARAHDALIVVDGISSVGAHDVRTDDWGVDVMVGGAQKGVMIPPGLAYLSVSPRALEKMKAGRHRCYYFDLVAAVEKAEKNDTPYTPAITLVLALERALEMIREEGLENVIQRHADNAAAVRAAVRAMGLNLFATVPSNATTAVLPPEGTADEIVRIMEHEYGVRIAGGQERLKGRIVRLGHLGQYYRTDMYTLIAAFEATLKQMGIIETFGLGLAALQRSYEGEKS